jgi:hypothetical protein
MLLPIQLRCMVVTLSGQPGSMSQCTSRSSAKSVILKNHCHSFFWRTGLPQRQHMPASTCSLASTVWQGSHQFT